MQIDGKKLSALVLVGGLLAGCAAAGAPQATPHSILPIAPAATFPEAATKSQLHCSVGTEVQVRLPANPSTGLSWGFVETPDSAILEQAGQKFIPAPQAVVGAGGQAVWTFRGVSPGTTSFTLVYRRAWESGVEPARRMRYHVQVDPGS